MEALDRQQVIAGSFLLFSAVVFGVTVWPHLREPPDEVDAEAVFANESAFEQLVAANVALGLCALTISKTADALVAYQSGRDPLKELE